MQNELQSTLSFHCDNLQVKMLRIEKIYKRVLFFLVLIKFSESLHFLFLKEGKIHCELEFAEAEIHCEVQSFSSVDELEEILTTKHQRWSTVYKVFYNHDEDLYNTALHEFSFVKCTLDHIPSTFFSSFPNVETLDASGIDLSEIIRDDFKSANYLMFLNLSRNSITHLENKAFMYLSELISVDLSNNKILSIHESAFQESSKMLLKIDLSYNYIDNIGMSHFYVIKSKNGLQINLANNNISIFTSTEIAENFTIESLDLKNNYLKKLESLPKVLRLEVDNNKLKEIHITETMLTVSARNNSITEMKFDKNLTIESLNLAENNLTKEIFFKLKCADKMKSLDLSNTNLGPLDVDSFAEMTVLENLNIANSSLGKISFGLFSHQQNLKSLNISQNNLVFIDYHMFTSLEKLTTWDVSGNKLTKLKDFEHFHDTFPELTLIGLEQNDFSCEYLSKITSSLLKQGIKVKTPHRLEKNDSSIRGISCSTSQQQDKENLFPIVDEPSKKSAEDSILLAEKIKTLMSQVEELRFNETNLINIIVSMKEQQTNLNESYFFAFKDNSTSRNNVQLLIDQVVNGKMEQLMNKVSEQNEEIIKIKMEVEKYLKAIHSDVTFGRSSSLTQENVPPSNGPNTILLVIVFVLAAAMILILIYPYIKKKFILPRTELRSRRHSISTITTFDNSHL